MDEQELLKKIGTLTTPEHLLECAKAYAAAQVADKDAEIRNLKSYVDALESTNATNAMNLDHLDAEIERLRPLPQKPREGSTK